MPPARLGPPPTASEDLRARVPAPMLTALEITLLLLAASIVSVLLLRAVGMPALVAYLLVGVVLGPYAGNLAANSDAVHTLAELGVVFLMFTLGLEFNLSKLSAMRRFVFGLGSAQVVTTIGVAMLMADSHLLGPAIYWGSTQAIYAMELGLDLLSIFRVEDAGFFGGPVHRGPHRPTNLCSLVPSRGSRQVPFPVAASPGPTQSQCFR